MPPSTFGKSLAFVVLGLVIGCGGAVSPAITDDSDSGGLDDAATKDAGRRETSTSDGATTDAGPFACGTTTCQGTEFCVHPCCGGAPPPCSPVPDSGDCGPGSSYIANCNFGLSGPGCMPDPCTPEPPFCSSKGDMCGPPPSGSRDVTCACG